MIYLKVMIEKEIQPAPEMSKQEEQELLQNILRSTERTRKMFMWTLILSIVAFVLPIVGLVFAIPFFIDTYLSTLSDITSQLGI